MKVCCLSGTKPQEIIRKNENIEVNPNRLWELIKGKLEELIECDHVTHFISGMIMGADTITAEIVLELKKTYPITLECVLPCVEQSPFFGQEEREKYLAIARQADKETLLQNGSSSEYYKLLTKYLVAKGDFFMVILDGMPEYALDTVCSAFDKGKSIFIINPRLL